MSAEPRPLPPGMGTWIAALCAELGVDPSRVDTTALLEVVGDVAHNVNRPAAPLSAFVIGLAAAGGNNVDLPELLERTRHLALSWR